ncbi:tetratricopeptide repeat protein [Planctomicrobium sp. SH664]|uniref:tetratricopeptide repeat protein n=1 Tax=Planctomicrobium sp. SH664 TaxID=3448125 RepID=UPI003F5AE55F
MSFSFRILACHAFFGIVLAYSRPSANGALFAAENEVRPLNPPQSLIVKTPRASVMAGEKTEASAPLGSLISATHGRGPWRFSPEFQGWIHETDLIPIDQAVGQFTTEIEREPTAQAYHLRGIAWMSRKDFRKAVQDLERAYELGESAVSLHFNLGLCYLELGHESSALNEFDSILKAYPDEVPARLERGKIHLQKGHFETALNDFTSVIKLVPRSDEAFALQGIALRMQGNYDGAVVAYSRALELNPNDAETLSNRAYARKCLGNYEVSLQDYEAALKLQPDSDEIKNDLAWLLATCPDEKIRQPARAVELSNAAWEESGKKNADYADTLAAAYAAQGNFPAAIEAAALAATLLRDQPGLPPVESRLKGYRAQQPYYESRPHASAASAQPAATPVDTDDDEAPPAPKDAK